MRKNLSNKYSQKLLDHDKQFATDAFKATSKTAILKTDEATGDLICYKTDDRIIGTAHSKSYYIYTNRKCIWKFIRNIKR